MSRGVEKLIFINYLYYLNIVAFYQVSICYVVLYDNTKKGLGGRANEDVWYSNNGQICVIYIL